MSDTLWIGQTRGKTALKLIINIIQQNQCLTIKKLAGIISFHTGISINRIFYEYFQTLESVDLLMYEDGKEWEEENHAREQLGKSPIPFEEWLKTRPQNRVKPLGAEE
jgi:hypothetical protein